MIADSLLCHQIPPPWHYHHYPARRGESGAPREIEAIAGVMFLSRLEGEGRWMSGTPTKCSLL